MDEKAQIEQFIDYASKLDGDEKSEAQVFLDRLFIGFGHKGYKEAGATLEARIRNRDGGTSFADLRWKDVLLLEMKKKGEKLHKHYQQAFDYWINSVPHRPRYVVLCNFDEFWIYDLDQQIAEPVDEVALKDLPTRYEALNFLFADNRTPLFGNDRVAVTRQAADKVARVFQSLVKRSIPREDAQRFILQCVTAMFAEDIGLLPHHVFTHLIADCADGASSYDLLGGLFRQMNEQKPAKGGRYTEVPYFNGGLFEKVESVDLTTEELLLIHMALEEDWSKVEPPIFGTLFQASMDERDRHAFGAHFTSEVDILRVILPTIAIPWRERIERAKTLSDLIALRNQMSQFRVLDPACGSGNFLYIAYRELKRLEMSLLQKAHQEFKRGFATLKTGPAIHVQQFHGIDVIPFAVELAKVTLAIGKKLAIDEARKTLDAPQMDLDLEHDFERALPMDNLDNNVRCADALFTAWPAADSIIGNPPYQSKNKMQQEYGRKYLNELRDKFPGVPGRADYCVYWFRKAHDALPQGGRAGLVGTNTIRQNYSREGGLDYIVSHGGTITDAVSTQEWSGDAVVHVSIVNWLKGEQKGSKRLLTQNLDAPGKGWTIETPDKITSSLTSGTDATTASRLEANKRAPFCFQGQTHGHEGFILDDQTAQQMLASRAQNCDVLFPYLIARELLSAHPPKPDRWVIDFSKLSVTEAARYKEPFSRVKSLVLPDRQKAAMEEDDRNKEALAADPNARVNHHHRRFLNEWWLLSWGRQDLIDLISTIPRYIVCSQVTKRPIFEFVASEIRPNASLIVFAAADDYCFGVLQSSQHWEWFKAKCSTLKGDFRYTSDTVFDTFPWPQDPGLIGVKRVANAAVELRRIRAKIMRDNGWSLREVYRSLEQPGKHELKAAQADLDEAVRIAYGMPKTASTLEFLLNLNSELEEAEQHKNRVIGPGLDALGGDFAAKKQSFWTKDCIEA
jgi:type II restriction/modification system DNA methylase subunit YeeA